MPRTDSSPTLRLILGGAAALALAAQGAHAADMPVKALPLLPAPSWTGFYLGVNAGYSFGNDPYTNSGPVTPSLTAPSGALLGGQLGYNWQLSNVVLGIEGDAQWANQRDTGCADALCILTSVPESDARLVEQRLEWFTTLRGRVGWARDGWLIYVTGGPAWARVQETDTVTVDTLVASVTRDATKAGWAAGIGGEIRLWGNWSAKVEYLHLDFGSTSYFNHLTAASGNESFDITETTVSRITDNIVRVGLNYRIGPAAVDAWALAGAGTAPMPEPAFNWTGFYLGANGGYGVGHNSVNQVDMFADGTFFGNFAPSRIAPKGPLFGGQAGYNWQVSNVVLGLEGDAQFSDMENVVCNFGCDNAAPIDQRLRWFATARGRLGWAMPSWMIYVTGGAAFGGIDETDNITTSFTGLLTGGSFTHNRSGWVAGGGLEVHLWGNWTGKLEYLRLDLGTITEVLPLPPIETLTTTSQIRSDIVRVGLNYKLGN